MIELHRLAIMMDSEGEGRLVVEFLAGLRIIDEDLRGFELRSLGIAQLQHAIHELLRAGEVQHAEGSAQERWKADAKHRSNITCDIVRLDE